jgi:hypothetical protein
LSGGDLDLVIQESKGAFLQKMQQHRYTEARKALEMYGETLRALETLRDQCATSLSKLAEDLVRVPRGSAVMDETERLMAAAQKAYSLGSFKECLALSEECRASGATAVRWHERCSQRLEATDADLLAGEGRRYLDAEISALMGSARKALEEGRYEDMDWALLKASRLHGRARRTLQDRGMAELVNLMRLYPRVGLRVEELPPHAKELLDRRMSDHHEVRNLGETIGAVRGLLKKGVEGRAAAVLSRAEASSKDSSVARSLLAVAERSLAEEKLEQAIELSLQLRKIPGKAIPVHLNGDHDISAGAGTEMQAGVAGAPAGEDHHARPVAGTEDALERLLIGAAGQG